MQYLNTGEGKTSVLYFSLATLLLHANSFVCVLGVRSQTSIDALFHILLGLYFHSLSLLRIVDLNSTVESRQDDAIQEQDTIQHVADLWLCKSGSLAKAQPEMKCHQ